MQNISLTGVDAVIEEFMEEWQVPGLGQGKRHNRISLFHQYHADFERHSQLLDSLELGLADHAHGSFSQQLWTRGTGGRGGNLVPL
ncbi:MAG: hypothetical protein ACR2RF_30855 [Geminicoccaceae bacterium]